MKKSICILTIVLCLLVVLCACGENSTDSKNIDALNDRLAANYTGWTIKVRTTKNDVTLTNQFVVTKRDGDFKVEYTLEELTEISLDNPTADFKTVTSGVAIVKDGQVTSINNDDVTLPIENLDTIGLKFSKSCLSDIALTSTALVANVTAPKDFMGKEIQTTDMKVSAAFDENVFEFISISYTAQDGANVNINYTFTA